MPVFAAFIEGEPSGYPSIYRHPEEEGRWPKDHPEGCMYLFALPARYLGGLFPFRLALHSRAAEAGPAPCRGRVAGSAGSAGRRGGRDSPSEAKRPAVRGRRGLASKLDPLCYRGNCVWPHFAGRAKKQQALSKWEDGRAQSYHCRIHAVAGFVSTGHARFAAASAGRHGRERPAGMWRGFPARRWTLRAQHRCAPIPARCPSV
jgi:hypothetical protein